MLLKPNAHFVFFSHKMFQNCSCQRKVTQTCSVNSPLTFALVFELYFYMKDINSIVKDAALQLDCDHVLRQAPVHHFFNLL